MVADAVIGNSTVMNFVISQLVKGIANLDDLVKKLEDDPSVDTDEVVKMGFVSIREAFTAVGMCLEKMSAGDGYVGGGRKSVMDYKVVQHLKVMAGDKSSFRQWHVKLVSAMSQVKNEYSIMLEDLVKNIDLGKPLDKVLDDLYVKYGTFWDEVSDVMYKVLIDKVEGETYEKTRRYHKDRVREHTQ